MEFIRISDSKLKIMLDGKEMEDYALTDDTLPREGEERRRAMRRLLDDARRESGFDATGARILVEMYPSRIGGCELYVTRVKEEEEDALSYDTVSLTKRDARREKEAPPPAGDGYTLLYLFEGMEALLAVCRQLRAVGYAGRSAAYLEGEGRYFLALGEWKREGRTSYIEKRGDSLVAEEYGQRRERRTLLSLKENAICLADGDAIGRLAPYYVGSVSDGLNGINDIV